MRRGVPVPLQEFNEAVTQLQEWRRKVNGKIVSRADAEKDIRSQTGFPGVEGDTIKETVRPERASRRVDIREMTGAILAMESDRPSPNRVRKPADLVAAWESLGLSPDAARIAAKTEREEFRPDDMSPEEWATLLEKNL